jgi:hypothetical protein
MEIGGHAACDCGHAERKIGEQIGALHVVDVTLLAARLAVVEIALLEATTDGEHDERAESCGRHPAKHVDASRAAARGRGRRRRGRGADQRSGSEQHRDLAFSVAQRDPLLGQGLAIGAQPENVLTRIELDAAVFGRCRERLAVHAHVPGSARIDPHARDARRHPLQPRAALVSHERGTCLVRAGTELLTRGDQLAVAFAELRRLVRLDALILAGLGLAPAVASCGDHRQGHEHCDTPVHRQCLLNFLIPLTIV